jgi:hypothetical protein
LDLIPVQTTPGYGYGYRYECKQAAKENNNKTRLKKTVTVCTRRSKVKETQGRKPIMHLNASNDVMNMQEPWIK